LKAERWTLNAEAEAEAEAAVRRSLKLKPKLNAERWNWSGSGHKALAEDDARTKHYRWCCRKGCCRVEAVAAQACVLLLVQSVGKNKTAAAADV
jgi:hypothetical protein